MNLESEIDRDMVSIWDQQTGCEQFIGEVRGVLPRLKAHLDRGKSPSQNALSILTDIS